MGARFVTVIGQSGSGKSTSLRYIDPKTTGLITPNSKDFPIPGMAGQFVEKKNKFTTDEITDISKYLKGFSTHKPEIKLIIIEDLNHFFNARVTGAKFRSRNNGGEAFARWNDFGADVASSLITVMTELRDDLTIVMFAHTDIKDNGHIGLKTSGKLLDNTIDIPSYVTVLLHSLVMEEDGKYKYKFLTNTDGIHSAKSPAGMFKDLYIPNDIMLVLKSMDEYKKGNIKPEWID